MPDNLGAGGDSSPLVPLPPSVDCAEENKLVYLLSREFELHRFDPRTLTTTRIGPIQCPVLSAPQSMAVDRSGRAWVLYDDGSLFHVSTTTAECTPTQFAPNQEGVRIFGMAFVSDAEGSTSETLFLNDNSSPANLGNVFGIELMNKGLARIDASTLKLSVIGPYDQPLAAVAEMTGTGDGRLYGYFAAPPGASATPPTLAQIDKGSAKILWQQPGPPGGPAALAIAFWGGDFWLFTSDGNVPSKVERFATTLGQWQLASPNIGFIAVGAGVSTCAPVKAPE